MSPMTIKIPARPTPSSYKNEAERRRAEKLRQDPMATIITPAIVQCNRCKSRVKLSDSYGYEQSHWRIHRQRCLKRTPHQLKLLRATGNSSGKTSSETPSPLSTPSLTSDDEDDSSATGMCMSVDEVELPKKTPAPAAAAPRMPSPPPLPNFKPLVCHPRVRKYLERVHGTSAYPTLDGTWREWSWSRIQLANFTTLPAEQDSVSESEASGPPC